MLTEVNWFVWLSAVCGFFPAKLQEGCVQTLYLWLADHQGLTKPCEDCPACFQIVFDLWSLSSSVKWEKQLNCNSTACFVERKWWWFLFFFCLFYFWFFGVFFKGRGFFLKEKDKVNVVWKQILTCLSVVSRISLKQDINRPCKVQMNRKSRHKLLDLNKKIFRTLQIYSK